MEGALPDRIDTDATPRRRSDTDATTKSVPVKVYFELEPERPTPGLPDREDASGLSMTSVLSEKRYTRKAGRKITNAQLLGFDTDEIRKRINSAVSSSTVKSKARDEDSSKSGYQPLQNNKGEDPEKQASEPQILDLHALRQSGCSVESIGKSIYDIMHVDEKPNFLPHVHLDQDGGLMRIHEIWNDQRIFWFFILFGSIVFNITQITKLDWMIFQGFSTSFLQKEGKVIAAALHSGEYRLAMANLTSALSSPSELLHRNNGGASHNDVLFHSIQDDKMRNQFLFFAVAIASTEVLMLFGYIVHAIVLLWRFRFAEHEYTQYWSIDQFFRVLLPQVSTFSALKMIRLVHPSLIFTAYLDERRESHGERNVVLATFLFVIQRSFCGVIGVIAFAVKVLAVGHKLVDPRFTFAARWMQVMNLLIQCMGAVLFERVLQDRLFLFIFGGHDTDYQDDERALRNVYQCRLAKQIWSDYWTKGQWFKAVVLLSTLDHYDMQALIIKDIPQNQHEAAKEIAVLLEKAAESKTAAEIYFRTHSSLCSSSQLSLPDDLGPPAPETKVD
jgi:hypothetical protein